MNTTLQDDLTGKAQITYKSEEILARLDKQIAEATQSLNSAQMEIGRLTQVSTERKAQLEALQNAAQHAASELQEGRNDYVVAQNTLNERQATRHVKELEKISRKAQDALLKAQEHDAHVSPGEVEQLAHLGVQVESLTRDIVAYREDQENTRRVHSRALRGLGEGYYQDAVEKLEGLQRTIEEAKQSVLSAQLALDGYLEETMERLAEWPDLIGKLSEYFPAVDDGTAHILRADLALLDALIAKRQQLKPYLPEVKEVASMPRWYEILYVDHSLFGFQSIHTSSPHQRLQIARDRVARVLTAYEQAKRGQMQ